MEQTNACHAEQLATIRKFISQIRDSIVVSISACHAEDPGSIPGRGVLLAATWMQRNGAIKKKSASLIRRLARAGDPTVEAQRPAGALMKTSRVKLCTGLVCACHSLR